MVFPYFPTTPAATYPGLGLLGRKGIINRWLELRGNSDEPLALLYTKTGVLIGMVYVLLPYMVLTLFAAMKAIDPSLMRAARGLGAVSYTHLRAHETVLDLVCRLLLEKKKSKNAHAIT